LAGRGAKRCAGSLGFFDVDERLQRLTDPGDQLLAFAKVVDFEIFRPEFAKALAYRRVRRADGRRSMR
jgi:hypothetical protein